MTEDMSIHRQLMRMHGFSLMSMILTDMAEDREVVLKARSRFAEPLHLLTGTGIAQHGEVEDSNSEQDRGLERRGACQAVGGE